MININKAALVQIVVTNSILSVQIMKIFIFVNRINKNERSQVGLAALFTTSKKEPETKLENSFVSGSDSY